MIRAALRFCTAAIVLAPVSASAHVGMGDTHGFMHGFSHPFGGIDHTLAMIAVGLLAAKVGGRALWIVPLTFISVMAIAGMAGMVGLEMPLVEFGIGLSVVVLGVAFAFDVPALLVICFVGFFAIFHGHSHGMEAPESISGLSYGLGFICATAFLHIIGIGLGIGISETERVYSCRIVQVSGAIMAFAGLAMDHFVMIGAMERTTYCPAANNSDIAVTVGVKRGADCNLCHCGPPTHLPVRF